MSARNGHFVTVLIIALATLATQMSFGMTDQQEVSVRTALKREQRLLAGAIDCGEG